MFTRVWWCHRLFSFQINVPSTPLLCFPSTCEGQKNCCHFTVSSLSQIKEEPDSGCVANYTFFLFLPRSIERSTYVYIYDTSQHIIIREICLMVWHHFSFDKVSIKGKFFCYNPPNKTKTPKNPKKSKKKVKCRVLILLLWRKWVTVSFNLMGFG